MIEQWQELKETITEMRDNEGTGTQQEVCKFLVNYMDVLEKQMQEPCDAISRQAVDTLVDELARAISDERCCISRGRSTATIMQDILDLPSVNPQKTQMIDKSNFDQEQYKADLQYAYDCGKASVEPKTGHWINNHNGTYECDRCGKLHSRSKYCPNCGSRMVEPQEGEMGIEVVKTKEVEENGIKYLNINVSNSEVERNTNIVRLCSDVGILEYVKSKTGYWIWNYDKGYCKCSECGIGMGHTEFDYCPNCGAKMVEPQERSGEE